MLNGKTNRRKEAEPPKKAGEREQRTYLLAQGPAWPPIILEGRKAPPRRENA